MKNYMGLRRLAFILIMIGLSVVLLSIFLTWSIHCPICSIKQSGWELISQPLEGSSNGSDMGEIKLIGRIDREWFFTGLIFIVLVPIVLVTAIIAEFATKKSIALGAFLLLLVMSTLLISISIINLKVIIDVKPNEAGGGLYLNVLGAFACLCGGIFAVALRVWGKSESMPVQA